MPAAAAYSMSVAVVAFLMGALAIEGRLLKQATYITLKGQQPSGLYSVTDFSQAAAAGASRGIRYNGGRAIIAGEAYPGARSQSMTQFGARAQSVPNPSDANTNVGIQAIASQGWWARAVAGSGVSYMGANSRTSAFSNNLNMFRPGNSRARGTSTAFTDPAAQSAAVGGMGNGPAAMSWGLQTAAFARTQRSDPVMREQGDKWKAKNPGSVYADGPSRH
eukprot:gene2384-2688_t